VVIAHLPPVEAVQTSGRSGVTMLAKCGILQGNPTRRVVNIGRVTTVAAAAVEAPDLAGSRPERAVGWSVDRINNAGRC
jgi:hypothetical protein